MINELKSTPSGLVSIPKFGYAAYEMSLPFINYHSDKYDALLRDDAPKSVFIPEAKLASSRKMDARMKNKVQARRSKNRVARKQKRKAR